MPEPEPQASRRTFAFPLPERTAFALLAAVCVLLQLRRHGAVVRMVCQAAGCSRHTGLD